jgi:hypothetical protein
LLLCCLLPWPADPARLSELRGPNGPGSSGSRYCGCGATPCWAGSSLLFLLPDLKCGESNVRVCERERERDVCEY